MHVADAQPGDIVLDSQQPPVCWQRGDKFFNWSTFSGPVLHYGEWQDSYGPQGDVVLLVRDGTPVASVAPEGQNKPVSADTVAQAEDQ